MHILIASLVVCLQAPPEPAALIQERYSRIQALLAKGATPATVTESVADALDAVVDFPELGRLTMSLHWQALSGRDKARFLEGFSALVKRQFARRVLSSRDLTLRVDGSERSGGTTRVRTSLTGRKSAIEIDFLFGKSGNTWKVFDFSIDGVDQARAWGRSFDRAMRRGGLEEVLSRMARKR